MFKLDLEKAEEPEIKLPTSAGSWKRQKSSRKTSISALLTMPKPLTVWITINCGKFWKRQEYTALTNSFLDLELICCSISSSNCCFLICIQISQEAGQVVWYSHLFQDFPEFAVVHTVKGFDIVNRAEIDVFLELSCFFDDPADVGNLISDSSAFSKFSLYIWKFSVCVLWSLAWRILRITL